MKLLRELKEEIKNPKTLLFLGVLVVAAAFIFQTGLVNKKKLEEDKGVVVGVTLGIEVCNKNSPCLKYKFDYMGESFVGYERVSYEFRNWCELNNDCKSIPIEIEFERSNPKNKRALWEKLNQSK